MAIITRKRQYSLIVLAVRYEVGISCGTSCFNTHSLEASVKRSLVVSILTANFHNSRMVNISLIGIVGLAIRGIRRPWTIQFCFS